MTLPSSTRIGTVRCPFAILRMRSRAALSASTSYSTKSLRFHSSQSRISLVCGQRAVPKSSSLGMFAFLDAQDLQQLAHDMINRSLHFLNARNVIAVHDDRKIRESLAFNFAAIVAEERDGQHFSF